MPYVVELITHQRLHGPLQYDGSEVAWITRCGTLFYLPPTGIDIYKGSITRREL
jgi:hypothetical protein